MDQTGGKKYIRCYMPSLAKGTEKTDLLSDSEGVLTDNSPSDRSCTKFLTDIIFLFSVCW